MKEPSDPAASSTEQPLATLDASPSQEKALRLLEFPRIQRGLARHTSFSPGQALALAWHPAFSYSDVVELQAETSEARRLLEEGLSHSLAGAEDLRPIADRAARHGLLEASQLLAIAQTLAQLRTLRNALLRKHAQARRLAQLARLLPESDDLERQIRRCVDLRGEVVDDASPELRGARSAARNAHQRLYAVLERLVHSSWAQEVLQEPLVTLRGGRLVVPVKVERRRDLPGLVHDTSDSGATFFVEPLSTVELGNELLEAQALERREAERVLRRLSEAVAQEVDSIQRAVEAAASLDLVFARALYSQALEAVPPQLLAPGKPRRVELTQARHPLLPGPVVPISVSVGDDFTVLLITGPNTGGKTVTLKTIGLLALMAQAGLHVPAQAASVSVFSTVLADIGDEQSIEHSISSFSSHILNVVDSLHRAGPDSLVLLDELGSSTDPEEGTALGKAVLHALQRQGSLVVATTHHRGIAAFVQGAPGMLNASMELDPETLAPTFRVRMGLPGRSYALDIARRLDMPQEVLKEARSLTAQDHRRLEDLLTEVQQGRQELEQRSEQLAKAQEEVEDLRRALESQRAELENRQEELLEETRKELRRRAAEVNRRLRRAKRALHASAPPQQVAQVRREVQEAQRDLAAQAWPHLPRQTPDWRTSLQPGDTVRVRGFYHPAQVLGAPDARARTVEVTLGPLRMRLNLDHLERLEHRAQETRAPAPSPRASIPTSRAAPETSLRGLTVDEALDRLEGYLSDAALAGLSSVRIIHGKGTGALRRAIHERLAHHPLVASYAAAEAHEGGEGATIAYLA